VGTSPWKLSKDDVDALHRRRDAAGGAQFDAAWAELMTAVCTAMARGTDPRSDEGRALAERWQTLVDLFTGGSESIERGLYERAAIYRQLREECGEPVPDAVGYIREALGK
jgi:hypothetical protein